MSEIHRLAAKLERNLIPSTEWETCGAPEEAVALALEETRQGVPTGIAKHPENGWFVIQSSGQGPYIIWPEDIYQQVMGDSFKQKRSQAMVESYRKMYGPVNPSPQFFSASVVQTPKCGCGAAMEPASDTEWVCQAEDCPRRGDPVHTGVYPMKDIGAVEES